MALKWDWGGGGEHQWEPFPTTTTYVFRLQQQGSQSRRLIGLGSNTIPLLGGFIQGV
jgi:hypothetical protein